MLSHAYTISVLPTALLPSLFEALQSLAVCWADASNFDLETQKYFVSIWVLHLCQCCASTQHGMYFQGRKMI